MTYSEGEALLRRKIGLDASSIGSGAIARAIDRRMADCGITDIASYLRHLEESSQEWQALIDSVIVPETWFLREPESFKFLQQYAISEWLPNQSQRVLRVLSVPCSTGEEPYSIAIAALESGLNVANIHIDAVDISNKCLATAQRAIYDQYSFRGCSPSFQARYFQATPAGYQLSEQVRHMVNFSQGNLVNPDFLAGTAPYDVIFCRNLLIYFDRDTKERTISVIEKLLSQTGLLFVGHAEAGVLFNSQFVAVPHSLAFAYRKVSISRHSAKKHPDPRKQAIADKRPPQLSKSQTQQPVAKTNTNQILPDSTPDLLEQAKALANQGCLNEAIQLCNDYLSQNRISVEAYVLLGQAQQAIGQNQQAAESFQKAIYLQPTQEEALTHLALLKEHQGDVAGANLLWQRIHRLQNHL
ncbi:MAG: chemotaxis protein [Mojavia pulchra JT2-VF2]|jgi:chemotaxis protein methyltransferase WspC|uniref:protein-glutamate O-methyltransferase n=1 Tax=Mojavia pulchra JT2-VF2 TaxID=287848 RepID=A0A951PUA6_9NOST|nr:chemotaxis protein [Mojavia pulchra JT2-VF2]